MNASTTNLICIFIKAFCIVIGGIFFGIITCNVYIRNETNNAYDYWKQHYVAEVSDNMSRVINPEDNNITVSEGMGYGLLFSAAVGDRVTFDRLWKYVQLYLDENGLMNWKVDAKGNVIGEGAASDADQDIAYALLLAAKKWPQNSYLDDAKRMIDSIAKHEITSTYVLLPGDKWGENPPINPSYIAPAYYLEFSLVSEKNYWDKVSSVNMELLNNIANEKTGLFPDWANQDCTIRNKDDIFGYDAIRVPIRLLQFYKRTKNTICAKILQKQYDVFSNINIEDLSSGYTVEGQPLVSYLNGSYLSSFTAISCRHSYSMFNIHLIYKLVNINPEDYYGNSLKVWTLLIITGKL